MNKNLLEISELLRSIMKYLEINFGQEYKLI